MRATYTALAVLGSAVLLDAGWAGAARPTAPERCTATKLLAAGAEARAALFCAQRAPAATSAACVAAAARRRDAAFARADASGACPAAGESAALGAAVEALVGEVVTLLEPPGTTGSRCAFARLGAAARAAGALARAHARDLRMADAGRLANDLAAARAQLAREFARAQARGDCAPPPDAEDAFALLADGVAGLRALLTEPPGIPCPCWTRASLDASFPPGYFDASGRGGATCDLPSPIIGFSALDACTLHGPAGMTFTFPRGGAGVIGEHTCVLFPDLDPTDSGTCGGPPLVQSTTPEESATCVAAMQASQAFRDACL